VHADGVTFHQAAHDDPNIRAVLAPEAIDRALDPASYLGSADALIDRALAAYRGLEEACT
jgi:adenylosuccinate lyase